MRNTLIQLMFALLPLGALATPASHPVSVTVGDTQHATGIHLRFDTQPIDEPLPTFLRRRGGDAHTQAAVSLLQAMVDRNAVAVGRWLDTRTTTGTAAQVIDVWHRAFSGFNGARVVAKVPMGDSTLFLWTARRPAGQPGTGPWLRALTVFPRGNGLKVDLVRSDRPVERLVLKTVEAQRTQPARFGAVNAPQGNYALPLKPGVRLEFTGTALDYDVMHQSPPTNPSGALAAYSELMGVLRDGKIGPFAQRHDARSQNKIMGWYQGKPDQMRSWWAWVRQNRQALLLIEAGDFAVVFVAEGPLDHAPQRVTRWDWLQRTPTGWRPINFQRFSAIDSVFQKAAFPTTEEGFDAVLRGAAR